MKNERSIIPANVKTKLDNMNLLDRFLFNETVEDIDVYNVMVEILLDGHVAMMNWSETEKELRVSPQLREVRLDVIGADVSLLEPGSGDFNKLNDLTTILVAPFDLFGYGLYRYTFEEYCQEISEEFLDFMEYINKTTDSIAEKSKSNRIKKIHSRVRRVKDSEKVGVKLMQAWEERYYDKLEAREEGRVEGCAEGELRAVIRMTCRKLRKSLSVQEIVEDLEEDENLVATICKAAESFAPEYDEQKIWEAYKEIKRDN